MSPPKPPKLGLPPLRKFKPLVIRTPLHERVTNLLATGKLRMPRQKSIGLKGLPKV